MKHFLHSRKFPHPRSHSIMSPTQGSIVLNSVPIAHCVYPSISYRCNPVLQIYLCLTSFVIENVFEIHPCWCLYRWYFFLNFQVLHFINITHFYQISLFLMDMGVFSILMSMNKCVLNILTQSYLDTGSYYSYVNMEEWYYSGYLYF